MQMTYSQKNDIAQKKDAPNAASVLDASSQSESLQRKADMANNSVQCAALPRPNNTGMPDNLKSGIESLSGFSMDDVRVHYNSSKPATVQALAYTQGTDIHVAPGQEKCLPHEAWHVAQQMAGRVSPTTNIKGMPVNDNAALEHEADVMGEKAVQCKDAEGKGFVNKIDLKKTSQLKLDPDRLNVVGEKHDESDRRRDVEKRFISDKAKTDNYWLEDQFKIEKDGKEEYGDPVELRLLYFVEYAIFYKKKLLESIAKEFEVVDILQDYRCAVANILGTQKMAKCCSDPLGTDLADYISNSFAEKVFRIPNLKQMKIEEIKQKINDFCAWVEYIGKMASVADEGKLSFSFLRSVAMHNAANSAYNKKGVWKVGDDHVVDIQKFIKEKRKYNLVTQKEFNQEYQIWEDDCIFERDRLKMYESPSASAGVSSGK
jgi:hypothetical protein